MENWVQMHGKHAGSMIRTVKWQNPDVADLEWSVSKALEVISLFYQEYPPFSLETWSVLGCPPPPSPFTPSIRARPTPPRSNSTAIPTSYR